MDPRSFDRLSRLLAASGPRRGALHAALGVVLAGAVPGVAGATNRRRHGHKPNGTCRKKFTKCGRRCVDLALDLDHCTDCRNQLSNVAAPGDGWLWTGDRCRGKSRVRLHLRLPAGLGRLR